MSRRSKSHATGTSISVSPLILSAVLTNGRNGVTSGGSVALLGVPCCSAPSKLSHAASPRLGMLGGGDSGDGGEDGSAAAWRPPFRARERSGPADDIIAKYAVKGRRARGNFRGGGAPWRLRLGYGRSQVGVHNSYITIIIPGRTMAGQASVFTSILYIKLWFGGPCT